MMWSGTIACIRRTVSSPISFGVDRLRISFDLGDLVWMMRSGTTACIRRTVHMNRWPYTCGRACSCTRTSTAVSIRRAHEHEHVGVARSVMTRYRDHFEAQIRSVADRLQPVIAKSAARAAKGVYRQFDRVIKPLFKQMVREMARLNNAIDAPRNYKKLFSQCSRW